MSARSDSEAPDSRRLERLGEYAISRVIGEGGMGIVYEATERLSGRRVALKVLHTALTSSPKSRARFFTEMRVLGGLEHPNIVRSLASSEVEGKLVMALEYLEGRTLREELEMSGRLAVDRALFVATSVASALGAAHGMDPPVIHRDLKPENLMLLSNGGVKVMDFGVAKVLSTTPGVTQEGQSIGTVRYMSPEQVEGRSVGPGTDLYALGLLLYEMVSGRPPFDAPSVIELMRDHMKKAPPPFDEDVRRQLPAGLEASIMRLLAKRIEDRPTDAAAVQAELATFQKPSEVKQGFTAAPTARVSASDLRPPGAPVRVPTYVGRKLDTVELLDRFEKKPKWPFAVAGLAILGVVVALFATRGATPAEKRKPAAERSAPSAVASPVASASVKPPRCSGTACAPFSPPDPARVEGELIIDQSLALARTTDPNVRLVAVSFHNVVVDGAVDLRVPSAIVTVKVGTAKGSAIVMVGPTELVLMATPEPAIEPTLAIESLASCPFRRAFDVARSAGVTFGPQSDVDLVMGQISGALTWMVGSSGTHASVDVKTCAATDRGAPRGNPKRL